MTILDLFALYKTVFLFDGEGPISSSNSIVAGWGGTNFLFIKIVENASIYK
jgi:hypothetical protein